MWRNSLVLDDESRTIIVKLQTEEQRNGEVSNVVDEKSKKIDKNKTTAQHEIKTLWHHTLSRIRIYCFVSSIRVSLSSLSVSLIISIEKFACLETFSSGRKTSRVYLSAIKISWHPHYAIYPCELRDWSLLS